MFWFYVHFDEINHGFVKNVLIVLTGVRASPTGIALLGTAKVLKTVHDLPEIHFLKKYSINNSKNIILDCHTYRSSFGTYFKCNELLSASIQMIENISLRVKCHWICCFILSGKSFQSGFSRVAIKSLSWLSTWNESKNRI